MPEVPASILVVKYNFQFFFVEKNFDDSEKIVAKMALTVYETETCLADRRR